MKNIKNYNNYIRENNENQIEFIDNSKNVIKANIEQLTHSGGIIKDNSGKLVSRGHFKLKINGVVVKFLNINDASKFIKDKGFSNFLEPGDITGYKKQIVDTKRKNSYGLDPFYEFDDELRWNR